MDQPPLSLEETLERLNKTRSLAGCVVAQVDLSGNDLSGVDFSGAVIVKSNL